MPQSATELPDSISSIWARYEDDISVWATEQSALLRARRFDAVDIDHIAEEIDDVGKSA